MSRHLLDLTGPEVAGAIARNPLAVLPLAGVGPHGPHLPAGTKAFAAELVAADLAERLDALLVPVGPFGVAASRPGRPGATSLRPETFEALLRDLGGSLAGMEVETLVLVNWHAHNTPSLDRVAAELQGEHGVVVVVAQASHVAARVYEPVGGDPAHGGGIEALAVLAYDPALARLERAGAATRRPSAREVGALDRPRDVYGFPVLTDDAGGAGWHGDPHWATGQAPEAFAATVGAELARSVRALLAVGGGIAPASTERRPFPRRLGIAG